MDQTSKNHYAIAALLGVVGILVLIIFIGLRSQADDSTTSATVSNATPTIDTITVSSASAGAAVTSLNLEESTSTPLYVYGTFTDNNGCDEVTGAQSSDVPNFFVWTYRSGVATSSCTSGGTFLSDDRFCYTTASSTSQYNTGVWNATCTFSGCTGSTDVDGSYECRIPFNYFADPTDSGAYSAQTWNVVVSAADYGNTPATLAYSTVEINAGAALSVTAAVNYGSLAFSAASAVQTATTTNTGNKMTLDSYVSGSVLTCTDGTISIGQQKYTTSTSATPNVALTGSNAPLRLSMNKRVSTSTAPAVSTTRWQLTMPSSGLSGTCSGTITFTAY